LLYETEFVFCLAQVSTQVQLRSWQIGKLTAAWNLYSTALGSITAERANLMERLKSALSASQPPQQQQQQHNSAGVALDNDGLSVNVDSMAGSLVDVENSQQLDALLNRDEYHELCDMINANLAREDNIMILFDYAIGNMLDELQLALICVASWPYMPLLGCICKWLIESEVV
jgi:hypothetical protein